MNLRKRSITTLSKLAALALLACIGVATTASTAQADQLGDVKQFIASRAELAGIVDKAITNVGPDAYQIDLTGTGATATAKLFVVKASTGWAATLAVDPSALDVGALLPSAVLGDARIGAAFLVIAAKDGAFDLSNLGTALASAKDLGRANFGAGATLFAQLNAGSTGTLAQLANAGMLPPRPLWLIGNIGGGLVEGLLAGRAPSLAALDFSLTARVPSFVPAPFSLIASPKLTLGDAAFTFARTSKGFALTGEQIGSKLTIGDRTLTIPRTALTFTSTGEGGGIGSYNIQVQGASSDPPLRNVFGLTGVDLKEISLFGTISSKPSKDAAAIKGFGLGIGARIAINKRDYDGQFSIAIEHGALKEFTLALAGELNLGFLPGGGDFTFKQFALAVSPRTQTAALAGELQWRNLNGRAALVLSKEPILLLGLKGLRLAELAELIAGKLPPQVSLPTLDLLITAGFAAKSSDVSNLPSVAQALIEEFTGATDGKLKLANGLGIVARTDGKTIGAEQFGVTGPIMLAGSIDVQKRAFRLAASLGAIPAIPGLPKGFGVEAPEVFIAVDQKAGAPVASFGLGLSLRVPIDKQPLVFKGELAASTAGTFAFTGALETNWVNPFGLVGLTVLAPVVATIGVSADASIDLGFQAGMAIAGQTYQPMAMCVNLQAAAPFPVPKKLALKFAGSELGPKVSLEILEALAKSVVNGPLKNATTDPATRAALSQLGPSIDQISGIADNLGIPSFSFEDVDVALTTPGVTCNLPAIEGMGFKLAGTAIFMGQRLGRLDAGANLTQGFKIDAQIADVNLLGMVKLSKTRLDLLAPMPGAAPMAASTDTARADALKTKLTGREGELTATNKEIKKEKDESDKAELIEERDDLEAEIAELKQDIARATGPDYGHFYLNGKADIMGSSASVRVAIDKTGAEFGFTAALADFGAIKLTAETEGEDLTKATDFTIGLGAEDLSGKLLAKLGAALKASAATRKQLQADIAQGSDAAIKAIKAERDRLDDAAGKDYRAAKRDLKKARKALKKAKRAISKAKKKCEKDLGVAADLCGAMDAAKATLTLAKETLKASEKTLAAIKKSADYVRLKSLNASIAAIEGGTELTKAGLGGWAAVDRMGQMVVDAASGGVITVEEIELTGSLRSLRGTLAVTLSVGDTEVARSLEIALAPGALDLAELADEVADEITVQATQKDSPVWKALRAAKK